MLRNGANLEIGAARDLRNRGSGVRIASGALFLFLKFSNNYRTILKEISVMVRCVLVANLRQNYAFGAGFDRPLKIRHFLEICSLSRMIHTYHLRNNSTTWRGNQVALVRQIDRKGAR